jgi:hypothetical protein
MESGPKIARPMAFSLAQMHAPCLRSHRMPGPESNRLFGLSRGPTNLICWNESDGDSLFGDGQNWRTGLLVTLAPLLSSSPSISVTCHTATSSDGRPSDGRRTTCRASPLPLSGVLPTCSLMDPGVMMDLLPMATMVRSSTDSHHGSRARNDELWLEIYPHGVWIHP